jgi:hypothetical protein
MTRKITVEEFRMLAKIERDMDSGRQPYVIALGNRMAVQQLVMDEMGLVSGQTISHEMVIAVMQATLALDKACAEIEEAITGPKND